MDYFPTGGDTAKTSTRLVFAGRIDIAIAPLAKLQSLIVVPNAAGFRRLDMLAQERVQVRRRFPGCAQLIAKNVSHGQ